MAPISRQQNVCRNSKSIGSTNRKNIFKNSCFKKASSYISKLLNKIKKINTNSFLLKYNFMKNWNFFTDLVSHYNHIEYNVKINNVFLNEVYEKLAEYSRVLRKTKEINLNSCIENECKHTARYYASYLWSWAKNSRVNSNKMWYIRKYIKITLEKMNDKDMDFLQYVIGYYYKKYFPLIDNIKKETLIDDILQKLGECDTYIVITSEVIHFWFMAMPILMELSKHIDWECLKKYNAFLLDVDRLYSLLLTLVYGDKGGK